MATKAEGRPASTAAKSRTRKPRAAVPAEPDGVTAKAEPSAPQAPAPAGAQSPARKSPARRAPAAKPDATRGASVGTVIGAAAAGLAAGLVANLGRKAAAQAPSVFAGDWLEAVKSEYKAALALFDTIQATSGDQPAKRAHLLLQLKHALGKHAFTEENAIYPALREWGGKADADKLNHEHGYVKQYLYTLDNMGKDDPRFLPQIAEFREALETHIREEEETIFPPLHAALGDKKNRTLTFAANKEGFKLA